MNDTSQTLIVVRHGETRFNVEERFQGHNDSPLTGNGQRQVQALGRRIRALGFDRLISSDLGRALQTADAIAAVTGSFIARPAGSSIPGTTRRTWNRPPSAAWP